MPRLFYGEMHALLFGGLFGLLLFLLAIYYVFGDVGFTRRGKSYPKIPGWDSKPSDPDLGDIKVAMDCGGLAAYLEQRHGKGKDPVIAFWWHKERVVSVCTPRAFKETETIYNRPMSIFGIWSLPLEGQGSIQNLNDNEWLERKKLLYRTVRGDHLNSYFDEFIKIGDVIIQKWQQTLSVRLETDMPNLLLTGVLNTLFSKSCLNSDEISDLVEVYNTCKKDVENRTIDSPPPDSEREKSFQRCRSRIIEYMEKIRDNRIKNRSKSSESFPLVDALIDSNLSADQMYSDMITFLGGHHTSTAYFSCLLIFLAKHPNVQDKLLQDIKQNVHNQSDSLRVYVLSSATYLRQVIDEAHRLSAIAAMSGHYSNDDAVVEGYFIPRKTPIIHAIGVAMINEATWKDPDLFQPERFSEGQPHCTRGHEFRPFGVPLVRRCPASQFVNLMISVFLVRIVENFVICPDEDKSKEARIGLGRIKSVEDDVIMKLLNRQ